MMTKKQKIVYNKNTSDNLVLYRTKISTIIDQIVGIHFKYKQLLLQKI